MTYSPISVESFGGLNLVDDPGTVGWSAAIDLLNVDLDQHGRVRSRDGYAKFSTVAGTNGYDSLFTYKPTSISNFQIIAGAGNRLEALSTTGAVTTSSGAPTTSPHYFTAFGDATNNYVYIANGVDQIRRYDGAAFSSPAGLAAQTGRYVAATPWDNRLVHANNSSGRSRVTFSDQGAAETFTANNYVDIRPGDGQVITAMVVWRDLLFVFKETYFAVFYGTSTDGGGNPIFNYRLVDGNAGSMNAGGAAVADDGVYFMARNGIYRTSGGPAECVSGVIEPFFRQGSLPFYAGSLYGPVVIPSVPVALRRRVYFPLGAMVLVYDINTGQWLVWALAHSASYFAVAPDATSLQPDVLLSASSSPKHIYKLKPATQDTVQVTTDDGTSITSRYRSGFSDLGSPQRKRVREWILEGFGSPTVKTSVDFGSLETGAAVTLGTSPAVAEGRRRYATRGRQFSFQIGATTAWSVNNLVAHVDEKRAPGTHA